MAMLQSTVNLIKLGNICLMMLCLVKEKHTGKYPVSLVESRIQHDAPNHRGLYRLAVARESEAGTILLVQAVTTVINDTSPCAPNPQAPRGKTSPQGLRRYLEGRWSKSPIHAGQPGKNSRLSAQLSGSARTVGPCHESRRH